LREESKQHTAHRNRSRDELERSCNKRGGESSVNECKSSFGEPETDEVLQFKKRWEGQIRRGAISKVTHILLEQRYGKRESEKKWT